MPQALESGRRAIALAEEIGEPILALAARHNLLQVHHTLGDYRQAIELGRPGLEGSDEVVVSTAAKGIYGVIPYFVPHSLAESGMFADAFSAGQVMMRRAEAAGHPLAIELVYVGVAYVHILHGTATRAIGLLEKGKKLCETYGLDIQIPWTASCLGVAYALAGRQPEGVECAQEAVRRGDELKLTRYQPHRLALLSNAYLLAGRREDANASAQQALELARRYQEKGSETWALYLLAASQDLSGIGRAESAQQGYLAALARSEELGMRPLAAHCHLGLGQLYRLLGDTGEAREQLKQALYLYREMGMQHWPKQAESALKAL